MDTIVKNGLNSFPYEENVSPSVVVLTYEQLRDLIEGAVRPLKDEIAQDRQEIASLHAKFASLEKDRDVLSDNQLIQLRLIHELKEKARKEPGKTELSRAEKIERYLTSRPDHRASFETLKGHLGIDNDLLGVAIKSLLPSGKYAIIKTPGDKRKRTLVMLPR